MRLANGTTEVEDIHHLWSLCDKELCVVVSAECRAFSIYSHCLLVSWALRLYDDRIMALIENEDDHYDVESVMQKTEISCLHGHRLDIGEIEQRPKHDLCIRIWARMTANPRLIHANGGRWECDQSESDAAKSKEDTR